MHKSRLKYTGYTPQAKGTGSPDGFCFCWLVAYSYFMKETWAKISLTIALNFFIIYAQAHISHDGYLFRITANPNMWIFFSVVLIIVYLNISRLVIFCVGVRAEAVTRCLKVFYKLNVRVLLCYCYIQYKPAPQRTPIIGTSTCRYK